jgi:hypothetical protein
MASALPHAGPLFSSVRRWFRLYFFTPFSALYSSAKKWTVSVRWKFFTKNHAIMISLKPSKSDNRLMATHPTVQVSVICNPYLIYLYNIPGWSSFRGRSAVTALGDKTSFGPPFVFCVLELSRKSPCLWACFHSLSPLSVVSAKKENFNTSQYEMLKLSI